MTRARRWFIAVMALILVAALLAYWGSRPQRVAGLVMSQLGPALGLEITATGVSEYALRGGPRLVLRNVVARTPGATRDVLRANRIDVAVPWSTVRSRLACATDAWWATVGPSRHSRWTCHACCRNNRWMRASLAKSQSPQAVIPA